jgi:hypothetical protein
MKARVRLGNMEPLLIEAIERMCAFPESLRPFVIVEAVEPIGVAEKPFVQFLGDDRRMLILDVPLMNQNFVDGFTIEAVAHVTVEDTDFGKMVRLDGTIQGATLAQAILQNGFGLSPGALVEIIEQTTCATGVA